MTELVAQIVEQVRACGPLPELQARRLIVTLDRITQIRLSVRQGAALVDQASFIERRGHGLLVRHQTATRGLPKEVDRGLIWKAIEEGLDADLASAIWTGVQIADGSTQDRIGESLEVLREMQGPWGQPGANRGC